MRVLELFHFHFVMELVVFFLPDLGNELPALVHVEVLIIDDLGARQAARTVRSVIKRGLRGQLFGVVADVGDVLDELLFELELHLIPLPELLREALLLIVLHHPQLEVSF